MAVSFKVAATPQQSNDAALTAPAITIPTTTNGLVLAFLLVDNGGVAVITGDTMRIGTSGTMTKVGSRYNWGTANEQYIDIWAILQNQTGWTTGATTIVWNCTNGVSTVSVVALAAACFDGVHQFTTAISDGVNNLVTGTGTTNPNSVGPVTTAVGNATVGYFVSNTEDYTAVGGATPGQTLIYADNNFWTTGAEYQLIASGTTQTMTWTSVTGPGLYYGVGVNLVAAPTGTQWAASTGFLGAGLFAPTARTKFNPVTSTFSGAGGIVPNLAQLWATNRASFLGAGGASVLPQIPMPTAANFSGLGLLSAPSSQLHAGTSASAAAGGMLGDTATMVMPTAASFPGVGGMMTSGPTINMPTAGAFPGSGLFVEADAMSMSTAASFLGSGQLTGTPVLLLSAAGALLGAGLLYGDTVLVHPSGTQWQIAAGFVGAGQLASVGVLTIPLVDYLSGSGALAAQPILSMPTSSALSALGAFSSQAIDWQSLLAGFGGAGAFAGTGPLAFMSGNGAFLGAGQLSSFANQTLNANPAGFGGAGSLRSTASLWQSASLRLGGAGSFVANVVLFIPTAAVFVQAALGTYSDTTSVTTVSATASTPLTTGNSVVGVFAYFHSGAVIGDILSISDGTNNYTIANFATNTDTQNCISFYGLNIIGGQSTITVTFSGGQSYNFTQMAFQEVGGLGPGAIVRSFTTAFTQNAASSPVSSGTTPTLMGDYAYGWIVPTASGTTFSAGSNYTLENHDPNFLADEYQIVTSTGNLDATFGIANTGSFFDFQVGIVVIGEAVLLGSAMSGSGGLQALLNQRMPNASSLSASGALGVNPNLSMPTAASFPGSGALSSLVAHLQAAASANVAAGGLLNEFATLTMSPTASFPGAGAFAGTGPSVLTAASASFLGSGQLTGIPVLLISVTEGLVGAGFLYGDTVVVHAGTQWLAAAGFVGAAQLATAGVLTISVANLLSASGSLASSAANWQAILAGLFGSGGLQSIYAQLLAANPTGFGGAGSLTSAGPSALMPTANQFSAVGSLSSFIAQDLIVLGALAGSGLMSASPAQLHAVISAHTGGGGFLNEMLALQMVGASGFSGSGGFSGFIFIPGVPSLWNVSAGFLGSGVFYPGGTATAWLQITGGGTPLTGAGQQLYEPFGVPALLSAVNVAVSGAGGVNFSPTVRMPTSGSMGGAGALAAVMPSLFMETAASFLGAAQFVAIPVMLLSLTEGFVGSGLLYGDTVLVHPGTQWSGAAGFIGAAQLAAAGILTVAIAEPLAGGGSLGTIAAQTMQSVSALSGAALFSASAPSLMMPTAGQFLASGSFGASITQALIAQSGVGASGTFAVSGPPLLLAVNAAASGAGGMAVAPAQLQAVLSAHEAGGGLLNEMLSIQMPTATQFAAAGMLTTAQPSLLLSSPAVFGAVGGLNGFLFIPGVPSIWNIASPFAGAGALAATTQSRLVSIANLAASGLFTTPAGLIMPLSSSALAGSGALVATPTGIIPLRSLLGGTAQLGIGPSPLLVSAVTNFSAAGTVALTTNSVMAAPIGFLGSGTLTSPAQSKMAATGSLLGSGSLPAQIAAMLETFGVLSGSGGLTALLSVAGHGALAAAFGATGGFVANPVGLLMPISAQSQGSGQISALTPQALLAAASHLGGSGGFVGSEPILLLTAAAQFSASGTVGVLPSQIWQTTASFIGGGVISGPANQQQMVTVAFAGNANFGANARRNIRLYGNRTFFQMNM